MAKMEEKISVFLEGALKQFVENGIYETKVKDIATSVGITERTAFRYFETKTDMVLAVLRLLWKRYINKIHSDYLNLDLANSSISEKLKAVLMLYANIYLTDKKQLLFVAEAEIYLTRNGINLYVNHQFPINTETGITPFGEVIKEGIKNKEIEATDKLEMIYYNTFDALLGFMQKQSVEFYNKRITDEIANKKLEAFTDLLVGAFFN